MLDACLGKKPQSWKVWKGMERFREGGKQEVGNGRVEMERWKHDASDMFKGRESSPAVTIMLYIMVWKDLYTVFAPG